MTSAAPEHQYGEAFRLMQYRADDDVTDIEWIWNSRDGVTPFVVRLQSGRIASHVHWHQDPYRRHFMPPIGSRVFVDLTPERAREHAHQRVVDFWREDHPRFKTTVSTWKSAEQMEAVLAEGMLDEQSRGAPDLVTVTWPMLLANDWFEPVQLVSAQAALMGLDVGLRRDVYGYELSEVKVRAMAAWLLAHDSGQDPAELADQFILEMLTGSTLPALADGVEEPAGDEHVMHLIDVVRKAVA